MKRFRPHNLGLALGGFLASWHLLWAMLVFVGGAQWLLDTIFRLHMIAPSYMVTPFDLGTAVTLVVVTGAIGYVGGFFLGLLLNYCGFRTDAGAVHSAQPRIA